MAIGDTLLARADNTLNGIFAGWSLSTTVIASLLFVFLAYPWLTWKDPDTHPFLLARQATASPIRHPGESAVYRSIEVPYGYPLRSGLNVKDPGAPKWSSGRNGDLRDIWIQAVRGPLKDDGSAAGPKGKLLTVLGREKIMERSLESVTLEINIVGRYIQQIEGKYVAICLSNSVELLASIFACAFYGLQPLLIPYGSSTEEFTQRLRKVQPDILIAEAGTLELEPVLSSCKNLSQVIWVTKAGNKHMDFADTPDDVPGKVNISTWHDLIEENKSPASSELPSTEKGSSSPSNIVAAVAALINSLPRNQKISSDDVVLPISPLTSSYTLMLAFASLFSHATIALNSVAGETVDFALAASAINPTIMVASSQSTLRYHDRMMKTQLGPLAKVSHYWQKKTLLNGNMPKTPSFAPPGQHNFLSKLRLLFVYHRAEDQNSPRLSSTALRDLKILLGARTCYALTTSGVAGAIAQTNMLDYRHTSEEGGSHFGPPLSCVEVLLTKDGEEGGDDEEEMLGGGEPQGKLVVRGPAICGGERKLDLVGKIGADHTLSLL
ncbi:hypothetical protein EPUS_03877 [Endocarpon pusillum Z07020]|uniref:AMP-dependent synthetase/ligase domain-containing protein n=1 Tax=Endocarpon pusillum (strain Z07020 / HMAS-L-300199) TaxID=1263415 RepID=U1G9A0_ENDPU|nr:uncharacterized protein EPUS_03877 [Endocarpon pusillum Z07020]ERF74062.1 hypothetical protein EPUS_03877 [Endocarpon pusillum Z07020]